MDETNARVDATFKRDRYGITAVVVATILFLALGDWPEGYYQFLRLATCAFSIVVALRAHRTDKITWLLFGLAGMILFNPVAPIDMDKPDWAFPDLIFGIGYAVYGAIYTFSREELRRWVPRAAIGLVLCGAGIWLITRSSNSEVDDTLADNVEMPSDLPTRANTSIPTPSPTETLADVFEAATGHRTKFVSTEDGQLVTTTPLQVIDLPFGPALLTSRQIGDSHASQGAIGVYYFKQAGTSISILGQWPNAVTGWSWGKPPEDWYVTDKFTKFPAIFASGGFASTGVTEASSTLTELRPEGPITSELIGTGFSDQGARADGEAVCVLRGKIANIRKDKSFDVIVSGSVNAVDHYVKRSDRFASTLKLDWELPCPDDASVGSAASTRP